jgi:mannose-6-phosphate isomerase-like protein (cupin superfamily)
MARKRGSTAEGFAGHRPNLPDHHAGIAFALDPIDLAEMSLAMKPAYALSLAAAASSIPSHADTSETSAREHGWSANIEEATTSNSTFRTVLFTGKAMQLTVMSIGPGDEIGVERHEDSDQFLRVEAGSGRVVMGSSKDKLDEVHELKSDWAVIVPAGTWHNVINTGNEPLKLYSIYAPPQHPPGTVHATKADSDAAEHD